MEKSRGRSSISHGHSPPSPCQLRLARPKGGGCGRKPVRWIACGWSWQDPWVIHGVHAHAFSVTCKESYTVASTTRLHLEAYRLYLSSGWVYYGLQQSKGEGHSGPTLPVDAAPAVPLVVEWRASWGGSKCSSSTRVRLATARSRRAFSTISVESTRSVNCTSWCDCAALLAGCCSRLQTP